MFDRHGVPGRRSEVGSLRTEGRRSEDGPLFERKPFLLTENEENVGYTRSFLYFLLMPF
jgi:hypothetical protein